MIEKKLLKRLHKYNDQRDLQLGKYYIRYAIGIIIIIIRYDMQA